MNTDIRVATTFKGHRKRMRLRAILGPGSTDYLLDLWISAANDRPAGVLSGLDDLDIAIMAGYQGEPAGFVKALVDAGFLDAEDGVYSLHDWHEHNPFAARSVERGEAARFSRLASTDPELYRRLKDDGHTGISAEDLASARAESKGPPPKAPRLKKIVYGEHVTMTEVEHATLVEKYGEAFTVACIAKLSNYKGKPGGKKYKSDYLAILKWVVDSVAKSLPPPPRPGAPAAGGKKAADILQSNKEAIREFCDEA